MGASFSVLPDSVFPAYAGMFRYRSILNRAEESFPRIRGDVPVQYDYWMRQQKFSPHTRGCSLLTRRSRCRRSVFPAYAGMFPAFSGLTEVLEGFPRIRGDVPTASSE